MTCKRLEFTVKAPAREAHEWVQQGRKLASPDLGSKADRYTARLTLDITPELRKRIKLAALTAGKTVAEILRQVLEREFSNPTESPP